ncbi:MAG: lipid-A-disaccharide synthase [Thermodesulfobacteriota bacterium]
MPLASAPEESISDPRKTVMIVAGEASGDGHGAKLVRALKKRSGAPIRFVGIGGRALQNAGMEVVVDASSLSVVGITEVFAKAGNILKGLSAARGVLKQCRPDLLILIDFPDFNLHLAGFAKKVGVPVLYYISPQVWAWRSGRVRTIARRVDHMAVILPFEQHFYQRHKVPVTFVGHPLMDRPHQLPAADVNDPTEPVSVIGLLPGSRDGEVEKLLPEMLKAANLLQKRDPGLSFLISLSDSVNETRVRDILSRHRGTATVEILDQGVEAVFQRSDFVIAASGTVTLEAAIAGIPMVIIYKVSPASYRLGKALIRVDHISLVNLISGKRLVPELIQADASPMKIADTVEKMLSDTSGLKRIREELVMIRERLGGPGASDRVAQIALNLLR